MKPRLPLSLILIPLILLLIAGIGASAFVGSDFSASDTAGYFLQKIPGLGRLLVPADLPETLNKVMNLRLPRILLSLIVGAGLAWSGAVFQALFRNPLADPYFLGVSAGASFGSTLAITAGAALFGVWGIGIISLSSFLFAVAAVLTVWMLARAHGRLSLNGLILSGIAVSAMLTALVSLLMFVSSERLQSIILATMGSLAHATWEKTEWAYPTILISMGLTFIYARDLNLIAFGEESAFGLGVDVEKRKRLLLVLTSFTAAICVAVSGIIWFVGLIVPHIVRPLTGPDNWRLLPAAALAGGILLMLADTLSRALIPVEEIPIGIITALAGAPFFIYLIQKNKHAFPGGGR